MSERLTGTIGAVEVIYCMCGGSRCDHCGGRTSSTCHRPSHCPHCGNPLASKALNAGHVPAPQTGQEAAGDGND